MWLNLKRLSLGALLLASLSLLLFGCSDFGSSPTGQLAATKTISGVVSDPGTGLPLSHVNVAAYAVDANGVESSTELSVAPAIAETNSRGGYLLKIPADYNGSVVIEAEVPAAKLLDRIAKVLSLSSGRRIRAAVPQSVIARATIPPVMLSLATESVFQYVSQNNAGSGRLSSDNIQMATVVMETFFGPNFSQTPPPQSTSDTATSKAQQDLIVSIQAIAQVSSNDATSLATLVRDLSVGGLGATVTATIKSSIAAATLSLTTQGTLPPEYVPSAAINTSISNAQSAPVAPPVLSAAVPLSAPTALVATVQAKRVDLSWSADADPGRAGFTIYRADNTGVFTAIASVGPTALAFTDFLVSPGTSYSYKVVAYDALRNNSDESNTQNVTTDALADLTPPTAPVGLVCMAANATQVNLRWQPSTKTNADGSVVPATNYNLYRDGQLIATLTGTAYSDDNKGQGLTPLTQYSYFVKALDSTANVSAASQVLTVRTDRAAQGQAPAPPTTLAASAVTYNSVTLTWGASADAGVTYNVYRGGILIASGIKGLTYADGGVVASSSYTYFVSCTGAAQVESAKVGTATAVQTPANASATDTNAPTVPSNLVAVSVTSRSVSLLWSASTKSDGDKIVAGYDIFRGDGTGNNFVKIDTVLTPGYTDSTVVSGNTYSYYVKSFSSAGVRSAASAAWVLGSAIPAEGNPADQTPPTAPVLHPASNISSSSVTLSWDASTKTGGSVTGYLVLRNGQQVADVKGTSYTDTSVAAATQYSYVVEAYDNSGNVSPASAAVSATTGAAVPNTYTIFGRITLNGAGLAGISVTAAPTNGADPKVGVTDANGNYAVVGLASSVSYTVTPIAQAGYYVFSPGTKTAAILGANVTGQNFIATVPGIVAGTVNFPDGTIIGGITYPTGTVINGIFYPTATVIGGITYPTGTVIGGILYPNGVVIGGVTYPAGTVVGGIAFPVGAVTTGVTYPTGTVIGGVIYPSGTVTGGVIFPSGSVTGGVTYPNGALSGGFVYPGGSATGTVTYPNGVAIGTVTYPTGTVVGGVIYPVGTVSGGIVYPSASVTGGVTYPTGGVAGGVTYPNGTFGGALMYPDGTVTGGVAYPSGTISGVLGWP